MSSSNGFQEKVNMAWFLLKWILLFNALKNKDYEILHYHFGDNGVLGSLVKGAGIKGKVVTTFYGYDMAEPFLKKYGALYSRFFGDNDILLPICEFFQKRLARLGIDEKIMHVHHVSPSIDTSSLKTERRRKEEDGKIILTTIGRFVEKKGIRYCIEALGLLKPTHPHASLKIIGDGVMRRELESLVKELGIEKHVQFLGSMNKDQMREELLNTDIFLLHSITARDGDIEGTPTVLIESQSMRLPVVSTWHSGIPEVVEDKATGFLVAEKDTSDFASKIDLLLGDRGLREKMGEAGHERMDAHFNMRKLVKQLEALYKDA